MTPRAPSGRTPRGAAARRRPKGFPGRRREGSPCGGAPPPPRWRSPPSGRPRIGGTLVPEDPHLRGGVGGKIGVSVPMVLRDVQEDGDGRPEGVDRLQLEARNLHHGPVMRSEEHTSELQSLAYLV